jgi:hypothetical protein
MATVNSEDWRRAMRHGTQKAMRKSASDRQCPKCQRKSALKYHSFGDGTSVTYCRWQDCEYERGTRL